MALGMGLIGDFDLNIDSSVKLIKNSRAWSVVGPNVLDGKGDYDLEEW